MHLFVVPGNGNVSRLKTELFMEVDEGGVSKGVPLLTVGGGAVEAGGV